MALQGPFPKCAVLLNSWLQQHPLFPHTQSLLVTESEQYFKVFPSEAPHQAMVIKVSFSAPLGFIRLTIKAEEMVSFSLTTAF